MDARRLVHGLRDALVRSLRQSSGASVPFGSLAIVESIKHLKKRIHMINHCQDKSPQVLLTGIVSLLLAAVVCSISARAAGSTPSDPNAAVVAISQTWIEAIDGGQYQQSYDHAGTWFRNLCTAEEWTSWMTKQSVNYGKCTRRKQIQEVKFEKEPSGKFAGEWAYVNFESSFEKGGNEFELVDLKKEADGTWKVAGYAISSTPIPPPK